MNVPGPSWPAAAPPALGAGAVVLGLLALAVGVAGLLARAHRLPRNRVLGVRTRWTMGRVDTFRRANRAAAPVFVAAGVVGLVGAVTAVLAPSVGAGVTLLVLGLLGLVGLVAAAGVVGARFAAADEAQERALAELPVGGPCSMGDGAGGAPDAHTGPSGHACDPAGCAGACASCPLTSPRSPARP